MSRVAIPQPQAEPPSAVVSEHPGLIRSFLVRFGALYTALFLISRATAVMPGNSGIREVFYQFKFAVGSWVARHVLGVREPLTHGDAYSGDQLLDWALVGTMLAVAGIAAAVWLMFDRGAHRERFVAEVARVLLRYRLCTIMLSYGMIKILREQMPEPSLARLLQPLGESSPMGLLWTFMGHSWAYSAFTGAIECVGGLMLLFRRTTTLGALIVGATMLNVLVLNIGYDVPVKLYTTHYLVFAAALAARDLRRVADVFWFHRGTGPGPAQWVRNFGALTRFVPYIKALVVAWIVLYVPVKRTMRWMQTPQPVATDLYGVFEVEKFSHNGVERPPLTTDRTRWRRVAIDRGDRVTIMLMDDSLIELRLGRAPGGAVVFDPIRGDYAKGQLFTYAFSGADRLTFTGRLNGEAVSIELRRADPRKLLLREQEFRWVTKTTSSF